MSDEANMKKIAQEVFDQGMREQALKDSEVRIKHMEIWNNRIMGAVFGAVFGIVALISLSECTRLASRVSALESKQK